jgi:DNA-3-methyladenine glycosylase
VGRELAAILSGPVVPAARALLGCQLTANGVTLRLSEVEAYQGMGQDEASHAHRGRTPRNDIMFGPAGFAYAYFTYGMHWCINVVTGTVGEASAVLLRAGTVTDGLELARARRPGASDRDLARGPARLTVALGLDGSAYGVNLLEPVAPVRLEPGPVRIPKSRIRSGPRVGVAGAADRPWRFWVDGEPSVSVYRAHIPRRRPDK